MSNLRLTLACGDLPYQSSLKDGEIKPEGIELTYLPLEPEEIFWRMVRNEEFDVSEMSMSSYLVDRTSGKSRFIAIPVFVSRVFRHGCIYINTDSGIEKPSDLVGKKVGVPEYQVTAAVWIRGILQHEYGVPPEKIQWFRGGMEQPGRKEKLDIRLPANISLHSIPSGRTLTAMLESGELDAVAGPRIPSTFGQPSSKIRRLIPNYQEVEMDYFRRSGIFPIMHTVVIREEIYRQNRWVAQSLFKAFCQAKEYCYEQMYEISAIKYTLAWLIAELERERELMGPDPWPYGLEANRKTLETLLQYEVEQGLIGKKPELESLFAETTLEEHKI
ncbi:MAG: ABC transporter substrate-binding protein [Chloroflexi bacterium]|nr:ABC transporter substrate-binding protein [Chloroflexota bacterium]